MTDPTAIHAGKLRHRFTIYDPGYPGVESANTFGDVSAATPRLVATVYASIAPLGGKELERARQVAPLSTHEVVIRYRPGMTTKMYGIFQGRKFNIDNVNNVDERNIKLVLLCQEAPFAP